AAPLRRDVPARQRTEPGGDAVVRRLVVRERVDDLAAGGGLGLGGRGELNGGAAPRDADDVGEADRPGPHDDSVHAHHGGPPPRAAGTAPPVPDGQASPRFSAISRSRTLPSLTRSPSCSHSLVTQARRPLIAAAVRRDSGAGTYMSSW